MKTNSYRYFLYKVLTTPTAEGLKASAKNAYLSISLLQGVNIASLLLLAMAAQRFEFSNTPKLLIAIFLFLPPLIFNHFQLNYKQGYKKIVRDFNAYPKGSLKYIGYYSVISITLFLMSIWVYSIAKD